MPRAASSRGKGKTSVPRGRSPAEGRKSATGAPRAGATPSTSTQDVVLSPEPIDPGVGAFPALPPHDGAAFVVQRTDGAPEYPSIAIWLRHLFLHFLRIPLFGALFYLYIWQPYIFHPLVLWFAQLDLRWVFASLGLSEWMNDFFTRVCVTPVRDCLFVAFAITASQAITFWPINTFTLYCRRHGILKQYQLERTKRMEPSPKLIRRCLIESLIGQLTTPLTVFLFVPFLLVWPSLFASGADSNSNSHSLLSLLQPDSLLPQRVMPFLEVVQHMLLALLTQEVGFYALHRMFHEFPMLYRFHKQHHMFVGTIGFAAEFAHPLEQITANYIPTLSYILLRGQTVGFDFALFWLTYRFLDTLEGHSGFSVEGSLPTKLGLMNSQATRFHDWHHTDNTGNYGVFWVDWIFGTMDSYVVHMRKLGKSL